MQQYSQGNTFCMISLLSEVLGIDIFNMKTLSKLSYTIDTFRGIVSSRRDELICFYLGAEDHRAPGPAKWPHVHLFVDRGERLSSLFVGDVWSVRQIPSRCLLFRLGLPLQVS